MAEVKKKKQMPEDAIEFTFFDNGLEIAVLNNESLKVEEGILLLGKIIFDGEDYVLESLTEEEDKSARKKYYNVVKLMQEDNNG